jgi:protein-tyrosine phosphatase
VIDLHTHVVPGVDDGVATLEHAVALVRAAALEGVTALAATPHVRSDYPTTAQEMEDGVAAVRAAVAAAGIEVAILTGGELDAEWAARLDDEALRSFSLAGHGRHLLVETPYSGWSLAFDGFVQGVLQRGYVPLIAHPERNGQVQQHPEALAPLVAAGALVQVTAASVDGRLGRSSRRAAKELIDRGLAHVLASDAHAPDVRSVGMAGALAAIGDEGLGRFLSVEAPAAIAAGEEVPALRPSRRRPRRRPW